MQVVCVRVCVCVHALHTPYVPTNQMLLDCFCLYHIANVHGQPQSTHNSPLTSDLTLAQFTIPYGWFG